MRPKERTLRKLKYLQGKRVRPRPPSASLCLLTLAAVGVLAAGMGELGSAARVVAVPQAGGSEAGSGSAPA